MMMTPTQRDEARHALGLPNKNKQSYRNRFCTSKDNAVWSPLVVAGLATFREFSTLPVGEAMFYLTEAGAKMALDEGEKLCPEDFPGIN